MNTHGYEENVDYTSGYSISVKAMLVQKLTSKEAFTKEEAKEIRDELFSIFESPFHALNWLNKQVLPQNIFEAVVCG